MPSRSWSIERTVVLLTPVFSGISAWLTGWCATHLPGHPHISPDGVTGLEIAGLIVAGSAVLKWLHGRQKPELLRLAPPSAIPPSA